MIRCSNNCVSPCGWSAMSSATRTYVHQPHSLCLTGAYTDEYERISRLGFCEVPQTSEKQRLESATWTTASLTSTGFMGNTAHKYGGVTYDPLTAKLFFCPATADNMAVVDPVTNATDMTSIAGFGNLVSKWKGCAVALNTGKIYCSPGSASSVLIVNTRTNTSDVTSIPITGDDLSVAFKWNEVVYAPNVEKLFFCPQHSDHLLVVDPMTNVSDVDTINIGYGALADNGPTKFGGVVYTPNTGKLYFAPFNVNYMLIVDPTTNVSDVTAVSAFSNSDGKWSGIVYAQSTGKLYLIPYQRSDAFIVNPLTNASASLALDGVEWGGEKWNGGVYSYHDGKIYGAPYKQARNSFSVVLIIDPSSNTSDVVTFSNVDAGGFASYKYRGVEYVPINGKLYFAPHDANATFVIAHTIDPCASVQCAVDCLPPCGWSSTSSMCRTGEFTDALERDGREGDCQTPRSSMLQQYYRADAAWISFDAVPEFGTENGLWVGATYVPATRMIYVFPSKASSMLIFDPQTNTTDVTSIAGFGDQNNKCYGGVYVDGTSKLYCTPSTGSSVFIVDPFTYMWDNTTIADFGVETDVEFKWVGAVYVPGTRKIYYCPNSAASMLVVDPYTNASNVDSIAGFGNMIGKWRGLVYVSITGKMYASPFRSKSVLIVDPFTNTSDVTTITTWSYFGKWLGVVFVPTTGKPYFCPHYADSVFVVDPLSNASSEIATNTLLANYVNVTYKWRGFGYNPNTDQLFAIPDRATDLLVINPSTNDSTLISLGPFADGLNKWIGTDTVWANGKLYAPGQEAHSMLIIESRFDPCVTTTCSPHCTNECGWDHMQGLCRTGGVSTEGNETSEVGDCPTPFPTNSPSLSPSLPVSVSTTPTATSVLYTTEEKASTTPAATSPFLNASEEVAASIPTTLIISGAVGGAVLLVIVIFIVVVMINRCKNRERLIMQSRDPFEAGE